MLLTVGIGSAWGAGTETFENAASSTSYGSVSWTGVNGLQWSASSFRTDQKISGNIGLTSKASTACTITMPLTSVQQNEGMGVFTFKYKYPFSDSNKNNNLSFIINGTTYTGTVSYNSNAQTVNITVNQSNLPATITINIASGGRACFDDFSWTSYVTANPHTVTFHTTAIAETPLTEASAGAGVTPPTIEEECGDWTFLGWSESYSDSETSTTELELVTLSNGKYYPTKDVNLYPVYTKIEGYGGSAIETLSQTLQYDTWSYGGSTTNKSSYRLFHTNSYIESTEFDLSTLSKVIVYGGTFGGNSYNKLTIAGLVGNNTTTWKSVTVSGSNETGENTYTGGASLSGTGKLRVTSNSGSSSSNGVRISKILIYTLQATSTTYYYSYPQCITKPSHCLVQKMVVH